MAASLPRWLPTDWNKQKEYFSYAYIKAVVAAAECEEQQAKFLDPDGIDIAIAASRLTGQLDCPQLNIQVKSTSIYGFQGTDVVYDLRVKNYNDLVKRVHVPRILAVLLLPRDWSELLTQSDNELCLRRCTYWCSLLGRTASTQSKDSTVRVKIPMENHFGVEQLRAIMERICDGQKP